MTDLVTDAAIDAASEAVFANRGLSNDPLIPVLNAAAPHIAAEALRQAASEQRKQYAAHLIDKITANWLELRADELERYAAFTDMVQLGQELEGK